MEKTSDGGRPYLSWNLSAGHDLETDEQNLVHALGVAVVMRWFDLPRDIQKRLFEAAVSRPQALREPLAKFLHEHGES
jgi:hypothetical protein